MLCQPRCSPRGFIVEPQGDHEASLLLGVDPKPFARAIRCDSTTRGKVDDLGDPAFADDQPVRPQFDR